MAAKVNAAKPATKNLPTFLRNLKPVTTRSVPVFNDLAPAVNLKGKSVPERAQALIGIAHPDFRESLERDAYEHRLIPRGFTF